MVCILFSGQCHLFDSRIGYSRPKMFFIQESSCKWNVGRKDILKWECVYNVCFVSVAKSTIFLQKLFLSVLQEKMEGDEKDELKTN